jgi:hypothetical protein
MNRKRKAVMLLGWLAGSDGASGCGRLAWLQNKLLFYSSYRVYSRFELGVVKFRIKIRAVLQFGTINTYDKIFPILFWLESKTTKLKP